VSGGVGFDHLARVLPDRDRPAGAAPDHPNEADDQVVRTSKIRVDTVVPANVAYPTDSGLLAKAVKRIADRGPADSGRRRRGPHQDPRPVALGRAAGA
jgi:hypothetical protein